MRPLGAASPVLLQIQFRGLYGVLKFDGTTVIGVSFEKNSFSKIVNSNYRAMHFSAMRGIAIACRLSVCPSVCNVGGL